MNLPHDESDHVKSGDKREVLIVRYECRDGTQRMRVSLIVRTKDSLALADALEMAQASGRFASLF